MVETTIKWTRISTTVSCNIFQDNVINKRVEKRGENNDQKSRWHQHSAKWEWKLLVKTYFNVILGILMHRQMCVDNC